MSTANTVYDRLRREIINGKFSSGEPLRQDQIAHDYGVSKIPVREALVQLEAEGFVEMFSGRGAFVARLSVAQAEEIYVIRVALEPILLERAIPLTMETDWLRMGGILAAVEAKELSFHQWHTLDNEFHTALYSRAEFSKVKKLVANTHSNLARYYRIYETLGSDFRAVGEAEHKVILAACKANDIPTAVNTLTEHLKRASARLLEALRSDEASGKSS
ncbi:MAG: GntR family transcriptional regulator [Chloroflexi bacterium]|nr:GntR family transcriptional regulator [Chloroflexota bacterium]